MITTISGTAPNLIGKILVPIPFVIIILFCVSLISRLANLEPYSEGTTGAPIIGRLGFCLLISLTTRSRRLLSHFEI